MEEEQVKSPGAQSKEKLLRGLSKSFEIKKQYKPPLVKEESIMERESTKNMMISSFSSKSVI